MKYMKGLISGILGLVVPATSAFANVDRCKDEAYKLANPDKCPAQSFFTTGTVLGIGGGVAAIGGVVALLGMSNSGSSSDNSGPAVPATISFRSPTLNDQTKLVFANEETYVDNPETISNLEYYSKNAEQYDAIGLKYAHARGKTGVGSEIKIMDDFRPSKNTTHGDNVSYIATSVAPGAKIDNINVANTNDGLDFSTFASSINNDHAIYNVSWEIQNVYATQATTKSKIATITGDDFINQMANAAQNTDSIFVVAAGNSGMTESSALSALPIAVDELQGHFINVVSYNTTTKTLADYSNQCGITQEYCIAAPGSTLSTSAYEYLTVSGTSFATPVVSGAIAILQEKFPYLKSNQITEILLRTATDLGDTGVDNVYGWGLLNVDQATKPVGDLSVAISGKIIQRNVTANVTPAMAAAITKSGATMAMFDEYGRAYTQKLSDNITIENRGRGFDRLHRNFNSETKLGILEVGSSDVNLLEGTGFMQTGSSQNAFIATNASCDITENTHLFTRGQLGIMFAQPAAESVINHFSKIYTASASVGLSHNDWTFEFAIPETIVSGEMTMSLASARLSDGSITFNNSDFDLATKPAFEYAISYKNITAGFVDNPIGTDEFYILAKTKFIF